AERGVRALSAGEGADSESRKALRRHEHARDAARPRLGHRAREQQMARVGGYGLDLALLAVEREGVGARLLHPERLVEAPRQPLRRDRAPRRILAAAELPVEARHAAAGVQAVSL